MRTHAAPLACTQLTLRACALGCLSTWPTHSQLSLPQPARDPDPKALTGVAGAGNAGDVVGMPQKPMMEYKVEGGRAGRFIIRSCFGGNHANFIASGSEAR